MIDKLRKAMADPVEIMAEALEELGIGPIGHGAEWATRCPVHGDGPLRLRFARDADGRARLECAAGCELKAIARKLGLDPVDLFPAAHDDESSESDDDLPELSRAR